jgi:predicted NACHT family NTPase
MTKTLKENEPGLKFSDSQFVEVIIEIFFNKYFQKETAYLEKVFLDKRKAIRQIMKTAKSPEELEESITNLFKRKKR